MMKYLLAFIALGFLVYGCESNKSTIAPSASNTTNDTIRIANDSLEYEVIIIEPGFNSFLITQPPRGHYSQTFLENKNRIFVTEYNNRANQPFTYDVNLYPQSINYEFNTDYGYEVNYLLYNYFLFFMDRYKQRFLYSRG